MRVHSKSDQTTAENVRNVSSCCLGEVVPLERLSNDVFSSMILGDGFGVIPTVNRFVSPSEGVVKDVSESGCDVTIKTDDGLLIIVSVGRESSRDPFRTECRVCPGDRVNHSSVLWDIEIMHYKEQGNSIIAAVIVTNSVTSPSFNIRYGKLKNIDQVVMTIKL